MEPWSFRVDDPAELPGRHAEAIASTVRGERFRTLVYVPAWPGADGPFGVRGASASHAVGLTGSRLVLSADRHLPETPPRVTSIPLDDVLVAEFGSALLLGWLVVRYVASGQVREATVLHGSTSGEHLAALVRDVRALVASPTRSALDVAPSLRGTPWSGPRLLVAKAAPLLLPDEHPAVVASAEERWRLRQTRFGRSRPQCVSAPALVGVSDVGWVLVRGEPRADPTSYAFGVSVLSVSHRDVGSVRVAAECAASRRSRSPLAPRQRGSPCGSRSRTPTRSGSRSRREARRELRRA